MPQTEMKASLPNATAASSPDVINKAAAKLCHIVKRPDFDGYGFNLHSEKAKPGQFIGKVDANSPAEAAGLKEGDRIIEVNGVAINSETHKQVVQRIKAIACEVRLLLIDVEGKGDGFAYNGQPSNNGQAMEVSKTEQVLPGASENINSITMVSTKRPSQESQRLSMQSNNSSSNNNNNNNTNLSNGLDVTDKAVSPVSEQKLHQLANNNNVPPPPSATMASANLKTAMSNNINSGSNNHMPTLTTAATSNGSLTEMAAGGVGSAASGNGSGTIKAGSLHLPMTAAEMRAKLMMKKKYDPKNESVDLKKKYEIVQKL